MSKYTKYIIIADESVRKGPKYSYFYGGCILKESNYESISHELEAYKKYLGFNEIKREKITKVNNLGYKKIIDMFFRYIKAGDIRLRIMYSPNTQLNQFPHGQDKLYEKLYYTFITRAFSLMNSFENINLKIFFDELPETLKSNKTLKQKIITGIINSAKELQHSINVFKKDIQEVDSKKHVILQCVDVILGIIEFYLNATEENKQSNRGKAKIDLFNYIYDNYIIKLCPNFSFLESTGYFKCHKAWQAPYKHFVFKKLKKSLN